MTRAISQNEFLASAPSILASTAQDCFVIEDANGATIAALVSPADYELIRRAAAEDAIAAMREFGDRIQAVATPEEIDQLELELDRKAQSGH